MPLFDATTLLLVIAVFNGFMVLVWLVLARLFRIAPKASLLLAAANLSSLPGMYCPTCANVWPEALGPWMQQLPLLLSLSFLSLGVQRLTRLQFHFGPVLLIGGLTALSMLSLNSAGLSDQAISAFAFGASILALFCARDVLMSGRIGRRKLITLWLILPYALLILLLLAQASTYLWFPSATHWFVRGQLPSLISAWTQLFISMCIGIGLVGVLVGRLVLRITHMTLRDPLTDTLNRRAIASALLPLQAQVERGQVHSLVMIDVDHFKSINSNYGHAGGDAALLHLVSLLRANMRALDKLGRLGGEEFCLLLPHTSLADACRVAERMAQAVRSQTLQWGEQSIPMTASFGVARCTAGDPSGEQSMARADAQLYRAKAAGRDRVCAEAEDGSDGISASGFQQPAKAVSP